MTWRDFQRRQQVAEIGDTFLSYLDDGEGEPLVLLHGIPTWSYLWVPVLGTLTRAARVLAPDLAGFGFSDKRDRFDRSIARQAELIDRWMDQLGVESATIVGHDIGGGVALRLATLFPSHVRRLCVINTVWLAGDIPGAHFVRLGGARHFAMVDRPESVGARVAAFATTGMATRSAPTRR